jgi:mono/diheme cytochrome c family protein
VHGPAGRWIFGLAVTLGIACFPLALAAQPDLGTDEERALGEKVYIKWCAQCHGENGDGNGIAKPFVLPAPRDFTSGKYQIRSTPTGFLPTDDDMRRVIREGLPGTAMPGFPDLSEREVKGLVAYLKTFSDDFADPAAYADPISIPSPPGFDPEAAEAARTVYREIGCAQCHGESGRGDGPTAPTLRDDWGQYVRAADLTRPWTFNGGAERVDIYRSISTGLNGTPMAGFADGLTEEQRWQIVDFIQAISDGKTEPGYANLATAVAVDREIDLDAADELFADAPRSLFPLFGQIVQPGRAFHPSVIAVEVQAVYDRDDVAIRVTWHDIQANTRGTNSPDLQVLPEEVTPLESEAPDGEDGGAEEGGFWGDAAVETPDAGAAEGDFWGEAAAAEDEGGDDFWGDAAGGEDEGGGDFWGTEEEAAPAGGAVADTSEWSDAIALQVPRALPEGVRKPYFLFGDVQSPVDLWHVDLSRPDQAVVWEARGSGQMQPTDGVAPEVRATYEEGRWIVTYKRSRSGTGVPFPEDTFVPIAFSVWDGFAGERGSRRGLTAWFDLYVPPLEEPSPWRPVLRTAGLAVGLELLVIGAVRWRRRKTPSEASFSTTDTH